MNKRHSAQHSSAQLKIIKREKIAQVFQNFTRKGKIWEVVLQQKMQLTFWNRLEIFNTVAINR